MSVIPRSAAGIPVLGFGTWPLQGAAARDAVSMALEVGYRHIDTAQMYGNEREVGEAIAASGLPRDEIFLVTKVDPGNLWADRFLPSVEASLAALGTGHVDLLLIHWPPADADLFDAALERLSETVDRGLARAIGVSNFTPGMLERAAARSRHGLVTNQIEFHPLLDQRRQLVAAARLGLTVTAYCPLARGAVFGQAPIASTAVAHGVGEATVVLAWILQQGAAAVTMTTRRENALANLSALDIRLTADEMALIGTLQATGLRVVNPAQAPEWDG